MKNIRDDRHSPGRVPLCRRPLTRPGSRRRGASPRAKLDRAATAAEAVRHRRFRRVPRWLFRYSL